MIEPTPLAIARAERHEFKLFKRLPAHVHTGKRRGESVVVVAVPGNRFAVQVPCGLPRLR